MSSEAFKFAGDDKLLRVGIISPSLNVICAFHLIFRMRDTARKIEDKYFSNLATHVEFLPVEWRSKLALDGGTFSFGLPEVLLVTFGK